MRPKLAYLCLGLTLVSYTSCNKLDDVSSPRIVKWDWRSVGTGGGCPGEYARTSGAVAACEPGTPAVQLNCSAAVSFMQTASCSVSVPTGESFTVTGWSFTSDDGQIMVDQGGGETWSGPMVKSGTVVVTVSIDASSHLRSTYITVSRRPGWSWMPLVNGRQAYAGEIDACVGSAAGVMSGESCTAGNPGALFTPANPAQGNGFSVAQVSGSGPNGGVWYVSGPTAAMRLRTQLNVEYRADGPPRPLVGDPTIVSACSTAFGNTDPRNTRVVNTQCEQVAGYSAFWDFAWGHEAAHMQGALNQASLSQSDLHLLWEPLATNQGSSTLALLATTAAFDSHEAIFQASISSHSGAQPSYTFWRFWSGAWAWVTTTFQD